MFVLLRDLVLVIFPAFPSVCSASAAPVASVCTAATLNTYFSCPALALPVVSLQAAPGLLQRETGPAWPLQQLEDARF